MAPVRTGCHTGTAAQAGVVFEVWVARTLTGGKLRKVLILFLMAALLWLSACVTAKSATVTPTCACDVKMDPKDCSP